MADPSYPDALPGQHRLHWYVLERVLGQGGFGITYLARDTNLDQAVAIKEYLPVDVATRRADASVRSRTEDQSERYRWGLDRFIREARTLAKFDHPNVVRVHSVFEHNNTAYMVMRFEEGENLGALLERRRTLPEEELRRILLPILDGLELVHDAGFIHRDIKPDNVHIRADGSPVLLDFGSARHSLGHARTMTILVAPGYAPFEQYYSSGENQGPWTDLYSLGATCYRAIAGIAPMDAIARSKGILGSTREILVPAATIGAGRYSAQLLKAVDHALAFAEKDRPQSIAEWRKELTTGGGAHVRVAPASGPAAPSRAGASIRGPLLWATLGALVAALAVIASVWWFMPRTPPGPSLEDYDKRLTALQRAETERREQEALRQKEREADAQRQRDEQQRRDAERQARAAETAKRAEAQTQARREAEAKKKADAAEAAARSKREAEAQLRAKATERPASPPPAPKEAAKPVPPPAPPPDPLALGEEAVRRGNDAEALKHYRAAAEQGNPEAAYRLGEIHAAGRGVVQNNFQAYVWFSLAAQFGHGGGAARRLQVAAGLQPAEVEQADRLVRDRKRAIDARKG